MPGKKYIGPQLKELLSTLSDYRIYHLGSMESDLLQVNKLLKEAIETLGSSFMEIGRAVHLQQEMLDALMKNANGSSEQTMKWETLFEVLQNNIASAVTGLQFEDMTTQLVFRVMDRINGMKQVSSILQILNSRITLEEGDDEIADFLEVTSKLLVRQNDKLNGQLSSQIVSQQCLNVGDIELF